MKLQGNVFRFEEDLIKILKKYEIERFRVIVGYQDDKACVFERDPMCNLEELVNERVFDL